MNSDLTQEQIIKGTSSISGRCLYNQTKQASVQVKTAQIE